MLTEYLDYNPAQDAIWSQVMPGARACRFSIGPDESRFPPTITPQLAQLHFEALFLLREALTLTRRNGTVLQTGAREILLLSDVNALAWACFDEPAAGILVTVDARGARSSLHTLTALLGGLQLETAQVRERMTAHGGCVSLGHSVWCQAAFEQLTRLVPAEQGRYCVLKSVELLYLLCMQDTPPADSSDPTRSRTIAGVRAYMDAHLGETMTIASLSRQFCLAPTALKAGFRSLYGLPIHAWRRLERAAALLRDSGLGLLEIAQSVGYSSASQFSAAFCRQYGMPPGQYRKMSESAEI